MKKLFFIVIILSNLSIGRADEVFLMKENFIQYRPGIFSSTVGAHTEYHYLPDAAPKGNWSVSTFRSSVPSQRAWRIVKHEGLPAMSQVYKNKFKFYHPMLVTGDPLWRDYKVTARITPQTDDRLTGIVFRYQNDRCYYFCGVEGGRAVLKLVNHANAFHKPFQQILDESPIESVLGQEVRIKVDVKGDQIVAKLNDITLTAKNDQFPEGKVGLVADGRALFHEIRISTSKSEAQRVDRAIADREAVERQLQSSNPQPVLWKRFNTKDFGVGRNVRFGDLNNDGQIDVLYGQVLHHGPKDRNSEVSCLTAVTLQGKILWQIGEPDPWKNHLTNDVAFQIHDIDGDGRTEVVYCKDMKMIVVDGATGETKYAASTPEMPPNTRKPYNKFSRILGDSLYFCDLRGTGRDADIIIKDRYLSLWAYTDQLKLLWHAQCNTGHYPFAYDVDEDGRDELMMGYTLFDDDGKVLWSLDDKVKDHADGVAIAQFERGGPLRLLCAASDEGMFFSDMHGNILKHHFVGHVQNPAIADFRPDLPGLEAISINFWGNQGIVHFYDARGDIYHHFEPCQHGSMCLPINWSGKPGEYWVLSANVDEGGMFDGWGRRVVKFPADGHPDLCNAVLDITGDARDEIVVWDASEMWVYTQDNNPLPNLQFKSKRNPLYNYSNYQTTISLPVE